MRLSRRPSIMSGDGPSLASLSRLTVETAHLLVRTVSASTAQVAELEEQVAALQQTTVVLVEELTDRLVGDLVLPFERADLHRVVRAESTIVDAILRSVRTLLAARASQPPPAIVQAADEILRATELLVVALAALSTPRRLGPLFREIARVHHELESSRESLIRDAVLAGDRQSTMRHVLLLGDLADIAAALARTVGDLRILAAGAGSR